MWSKHNTSEHRNSQHLDWLKAGSAIASQLTGVLWWPEYKTMWWSQVWLSPGHHPGVRLSAGANIQDYRWGLQTGSQPGRTPCVINKMILCRADHQRKNSPGPTQGPPSCQSFSWTGDDQDWCLIWSCLVFEESAIHYKLNISSCLPMAWRAVSPYWQGPVSCHDKAGGQEALIWV